MQNVNIKYTYYARSARLFRNYEGLRAEKDKESKRRRKRTMTYVTEERAAFPKL